MTNPPEGGTSSALVLTSDVIEGGGPQGTAGTTGARAADPAGDAGSAGDAGDAGDIVVVHVDGILDATTRDQFADFLAAANDEYGPDLILDLGGVTFMDSRALGLIVHRWQRSTAAGGRYALVGVRYQYCKVMWVTGLAGRLPLYDTAEEALAAFAGAEVQEGTTPP